MKTKETLNMEEALGIIWHFREKNEKGYEKIAGVLKSGVSDTVLNDLLDNKYIQGNKGILELAPAGEDVARDLTRRHRLAERLLCDVVELPGGRIDETACDIEHVISAEVTDAICTLLGHPKVCPHGSPIPPGTCCDSTEKNLRSIVYPLTYLESGETAKVAYVVTSEHSFLHKLLSFGVVPGSEIVLHQKSPSYVIKSGETQIALDPNVASQVYVRKI